MKRVSGLSRAVVRSGLALACGTALAVAGTGEANASQTAAANGGANPYLPTYQHPYRHGAVPTIDANDKAKQWVQANQAVTPFASTGGNLQYNGGNDGIGVTLGKPSVYLVFWGSQWGISSTDTNGDTTFSGDTAGMAARLQQLFLIARARLLLVASGRCQDGEKAPGCASSAKSGDGEFVTVKLPSLLEKAIGIVYHHGMSGPGSSAMSVRPSWLKSPATTLTPRPIAQLANDGLEVLVIRNVPSQFENSTGMVVKYPAPVIAMSALPSWLKSPTTGLAQ